jgi:hypothetical protein
MKEPVASSIQVRAAVLCEPYAPLKIERLEMEGPREDELLVRIVAGGICRRWPVRPVSRPLEPTRQRRCFSNESVRICALHLAVYM